MALCLVVMWSGCTCLDRSTADAFGLFNLSVSVFYVIAKLWVKKLLKLMFHKFLLAPFFRSVVGWAYMLEKLGSDCCRFYWRKLGPFRIAVKWKVSYCHCYFYLHCQIWVIFNDFLCYNVIIINNYCIFCGVFLFVCFF